VPTWLWPELTMHLPTGRRNVRQPGPGLPAQFLSKVTSLPCPPNGTPGPQRGAGLQLWLAKTQARETQGFPYGRAQRPGLDFPSSSTGTRPVLFERAPRPMRRVKTLEKEGDPGSALLTFTTPSGTSICLF
jgi:hypothetical protein